MANKLPWPERVTLFVIHPDAASRDDIARLAAEWLAAYGVDDVNTPEEEIHEALQQGDAKVWDYRLADLRAALKAWAEAEDEMNDSIRDIRRIELYTLVKEIES